ncbi:MAG: hypothetical protein KKE86_07405 [Planctomycetes bacterium]|nr:hypothetical protein [Planctomycetota bacterium]MCG2685201.1 hypothetical protein [Planctomycetales bacterium]
MSRVPTLRAVLDRAEGQVNSHKWRQLCEKLEAGLARPLASQVLDDPIMIRRALVEQLRSEGASAGTIQALSQCFMGIIRRAAVDGLLPAPPEGPWTRTWQSVLDFAGQKNGVKALARSLAAWATERHLEPREVDIEQLRKWMDMFVIKEQSLRVVKDVLAKWLRLPLDHGALQSDEVRSERLRRRAMNGTVQVE